MARGAGAARALLCLFLALAVSAGAAGCRGRGDGRAPAAGQAAERAAPRGAGAPPGGGTRLEEPLPGALAVVLDNHPAARPQAGLERADLVYELPAEGGLTRYLALFASRPVPRVGPVRSARPYLVELASSHGTPLVHAGGSEDAYRLLARLDLPHLDEIRNARELFARDRSRRPPHNLYTSSDRLLAGMSRRGWAPAPLPPPAGGEPPAEAGGEGAGVVLTYADSPAFRYVTAYRWDGRRYIKEVDGRPAFSETGRPLAADTVVILATRVRQTGDALGHVEVDLTGGGEALILRGGRVWAGRWFPGRDTPFVFEAAGFSFARLPGVTWINVVGSLSRVRTAP